MGATYVGVDGYRYGFQPGHGPGPFFTPHNQRQSQNPAAEAKRTRTLPGLTKHQTNPITSDACNR